MNYNSIKHPAYDLPRLITGNTVNRMTFFARVRTYLKIFVTRETKGGYRELQ